MRSSGRTREEVASARRIVDAYAEATAAGRGSIAVDGKMVDVPVVERAQRTLRRHAAIEEREQRRKRAMSAAE